MEKTLINSKDKVYDVIVIGAGMAGLTAAAILAQKGARVLVCEQNSKAGGLFSSFVKDGYHFDGGIKAVENSLVLMPILAQLGLLDQIKFDTSPVIFIMDGQPFPVKQFPDIEEYFRVFEKHFSEEKQALQEILRDIKYVFDIMDGLLNFPVSFLKTDDGSDYSSRDWFKEYKFAMAKFPFIARLLKHQLRPYIEQKIKNQSLINLLGNFFPEGTSAFFGLAYYRMFLDYYYPHGGMQAIPDAIVKKIDENNSDIRLSCRVEKILIENNRAAGVRLANGEEILAENIIAASDFKELWHLLVPPDKVPRKLLNQVGESEVSHSVFNVFLGVDLPVESLGFENCPHIVYQPDMFGITDSDRIHRKDYFLHVPQEISIPCMHQPELAPLGKTGINTSAMVSWDFLGGWNSEPEIYKRNKETYARDMIRSLEKYIPGLSGHIEFCVTATPRTIQSLTSNAQGAIMGWSYDRSKVYKKSSAINFPANVKTPIDHLYTAGHWSFAPGGAPIAMLTGKLVADTILKGGGEL